MIKRQEVNIKVIAKKAGVSIATVSRFLNGQLDRMSQATADKVRAVVDEYGYVPNPAARQLMTHSSNLIAVVVANIDDYFSTEAFKGISTILESKNYTAVLFDANSDLKREKKILEMINYQNFDGLIIQPLQPDGSEIKNIIKRDIPVITFDRHYNQTTWPSVVSNNEPVSKEAGKYFYDQGFSSAIIVTEKVEGVSTREERVQGIKSVYSNVEIVEVDTEQAVSTYSRLCKVIKPKDKTVIFILKERIILSLLPFILRDNLLDSNNLTLSGFADTDLIQELSQDIHLVKQHPFLMGATAAELMDNVLNDQEIDDQTVVPAAFN